jgi:ribonuclease-3
VKGEIESFVRGLGHEPNDLALFELAFTHSSVSRESYERLEFLGDRVLGMVIAAALYRRYPTEPEGDLSRRYNGLVDRDTCAENGREIGVPALIKLGKQAREDGANRSENVVGDVVEALIGALFIDGGIEAAERFILKLWGPSIRSRRYRNLPRPRAASLRNMKWLAAPARTMRPNSRFECQLRSSVKPWRTDRASRKRKPPRPQLCCRNCNE